MFAQICFVVVVGLTLRTKYIVHRPVVGLKFPVDVTFYPWIRMTNVGVKMTLHPESHSSPTNMSAVSPKVLKTQAYVDACGRVIPRWDISIFSLWLDVISLSFGSASLMPCAVGCYSMHGRFGPMSCIDAPESAIPLFVVVIGTKTELFINSVISLVHYARRCSLVSVMM